jgi:hypothetical protein
MPATAAATIWTDDRGKKMDSFNQQVVHTKFGFGKISELSGNVLTVYFQDYGSHTFVYPQAFEKYLKAVDAEFARAVAADLDKAWEEQADRELENRKRLQMITEKAKQERLGGKKEKSAAGSRSARKKQIP